MECKEFCVKNMRPIQGQFSRGIWFSLQTWRTDCQLIFGTKSSIFDDIHHAYNAACNWRFHYSKLISATSKYHRYRRASSTSDSQCLWEHSSQKIKNRQMSSLQSCLMGRIGGQTKEQMRESRVANKGTCQKNIDDLVVVIFIGWGTATKKGGRQNNNTFRNRKGDSDDNCHPNKY